MAALQERLHAAEFELAGLRREHLIAQAEIFIRDAKQLPGGERLVARFVDADSAQLRDLTSKIIDNPSTIALLGAMHGDQAIYVFGRSKDVSVDMNVLLRNAAKPLGGKGGGRPDFAMGGGCREILEKASQILETA